MYLKKDFNRLRKKTFLGTNQIWVWWKRVKQRPKPQTTYENMIV